MEIFITRLLFFGLFKRNENYKTPQKPNSLILSTLEQTKLTREQMSRKRRIFSAVFKTKLVIEVLKDKSTLSEVASKNNATPKNLQNWKKILHQSIDYNKTIGFYNDDFRINNKDYMNLQEKMA